MPDHGLRPPPYMVGPLPVGILGQSPYGWSGTPLSSSGNTPSNDYFPADQFAYERLDWTKFKEQLLSDGGPAAGKTIAGSQWAGYWSNPPFMGAGQMTGPNGAPLWMRDSSGGTARILRGYIRRHVVDSTQPESYVRLYFMYNPDQVQRQYLSWNDSTTLDPANKMGVESDNSMSAIPSLTTISFTLYFDRQIEVASILDHPGVMVDLQTFDVLSGNMVYQQNSDSSGDLTVIPPGMAIPAHTDTTENHAGQIQPTVGNAQTMTTVVFSPSLAVEGILSGAQVTFTKFSPKMTPTTMALNITLMVLYAGKANDPVNGADVGVIAGARQFAPVDPNFVPPTTQQERNAATKAGAAAAVQYAQDHLMDTLNAAGSTMDGHYDVTKRNQGPPCQLQKPAPFGDTFTDCSSFVWRSFHVLGWCGEDQKGGDLLRLRGSCAVAATDSTGFYDSILANSSGDRRWFVHKWIEPGIKTDPVFGESPASAVKYFQQMRAGDVLVRRSTGAKKGHVAFFLSATGDLSAANWTKPVINLLMSSGTNKGGYLLGGNIVSTSMSSIWSGEHMYHVLARPEPWGMTTDGIFTPGSAN